MLQVTILLSWFQASDGEHFDLTTLTINVLDENDNAPQFSQQSYQVSMTISRLFDVEMAECLVLLTSYFQ